MDDSTAFLAAYGRSVEAISRMVADRNQDDLLRSHYAEELLLLLGERASVLSRYPSREVITGIVATDCILLSLQEAVVNLLGVRVGDFLTSVEEKETP